MSNNTRHSRTRLIVGLGNPGVDYADTKHNAGFKALDKLLGRLRGTFTEKKTHDAVLYEGRCRSEKLVLLKPMTFMNASGEAVARISSKLKMEPNEILLIYDDMDIPLGAIRIRVGGGSAGHNGVESVIQLLGSADFARLRIGIGREVDGNQVSHVLSGFSDENEELFERTLDVAAEAAELILHRGTTEAMNKYNCRR